jgi:D-3-phosphoglycerate dehydrogenase
MLDASSELAVVVRAGAGYNTIDVAAASRAGILVANCPGKNATAVAELTFALILGLDRRIVENVVDLRDGRWNKKEYASARGLKGRTLGILGMGEIGRNVAHRAHAFNMHVVAWSRSLTDELAADHNAVQCANPVEVASRCDILSVHLAAAPETRGIINAEVFAALKPGSYFINTSRAEIVDHDALAAAVRDRQLRVGLDVYPHEPATGVEAFAPAIMSAGGIVYGTHHIGASTEQAQSAIATEAVRIVRTFRDSGRVINCVNLRREPPTVWTLTVRHRNQPGVLAHVLHELSHDGINVEEMDNAITSGGEAACAHIHLDGKPGENLIDRIISGSKNVIAARLSADSRR